MFLSTCAHLPSVFETLKLEFYLKSSVLKSILAMLGMAVTLCSCAAFLDFTQHTIKRNQSSLTAEQVRGFQACNTKPAGLSYEVTPSNPSVAVWKSDRSHH